MKAFVPSRGRSTKGGNTSRPSGAQNLLRYFFRQKQADGARGEGLSNVNNRICLGNGSRSGADQLDARSEIGSSPECPPFLQKIVAELVSPEHLSKSAFDGEQPSLPHGNGHNEAVISHRVESARPAPVCVPPWKRILDVSCVVLTLPCWLPLMMIVMALVRITSAGPIIYRQERVGYRRRRFMIFKFRTMQMNAETRGHEEYFARLMRSESPMTKLDRMGDDRLIRGGRFLRATALDELPQIFNVLRGDMSLVGPRPCLPNEFERYQPDEQERVNALPGLTGYWQVNGKNHTTFKEMIAMDLFYIDNMSIGRDLAIILKTIPALAKEVLNRPRTSRKQASPATVYAPSALTGGTNGAVNKI